MSGGASTVSSPIVVYYSPFQSLHVTANDETPSRAENILARLRQSSQYEFRNPDARDMAPIEAVHEEEYLKFLRSTHEKMLPGQVLTAEAFPWDRSQSTKPKCLSGQLGWYCYDAVTSFSTHTWPSALESAFVVISAAKHLLDNPKALLTYSLCRPPGHHATFSRAGGFCYLNNVAIAANLLTKAIQRIEDAPNPTRIAILDIDYHGGNGTQDIFYERSDVFYASIHSDPDEGGEMYYWGYKEETGRGAGTGTTLNIPVPYNIDGIEYLERYLKKALDAITQFSPRYLLISFGADTYKGDKLGTWQLDKDDYWSIGRHIREQFPSTQILVVQEGGYHDKLGDCVHQLLDGLKMKNEVIK